ncbi:hypothetical protein F3F96_00110 [Mariprofundus sp. NF]|uniref:hypothetical protein n=1 Tax=Mariprofundus sp. NF TaxID=2608716 RepID=UPI0015A2CF5D|nr:hypothetical protein [Mariprofundus sp. NF]NWF37543.1 hypothetical protein [Mariprofundus sp. NF]
MHLSLQIQAQKQAEEAIYKWAKSADVEIGDVRYHLLRNGLILRQINIKRNGDRLNIDHMLIRAQPQQLTGENPKIGSMQITGLHAQLHRPEKLNLWQQDRQLQRIWQATHAVVVDSGELALYLDDDDANPPLILSDLQLSQLALGEMRSLTLTSSVNGAPVQAHWLRSADGAGENSGSVNWRYIDLSQLTKAANPGPLSGFLSGEMEWQRENSESATVSLLGELRVDQQHEEKALHASKLQWQGTHSDSGLKIAMQSIAWQLDAWNSHLPAIENRQLIGATLDGDLLWQSDERGSRFSSKQGTLNQITFAPLSDESLSNWSIERLDYRDLKMDSSQRTFEADSLMLSKPDISYQPQLQSGANRQQSQSWHYNISTVDINGLNILLSLNAGDIQLSELNGSCSLSSSGIKNIKLKSATTQEEAAKWRIQGEVGRQDGHFEGADLKIKAADIPLTQLRPLIPLKGSESSPLMLDGAAALTIGATFNNGTWLFHGRASSENLLLAHAGNRWMAEKVTTSFGPVGTAGDIQHVQSLLAEKWHYIAPLQPLSPYLKDNSSAEPAPQQQAWWAENLIAGKWQVDEIHWKNGHISVGQADSYWLKDAELQLASLSPQSASSIVLEGKMGGGAFKLDGQWSPLAASEQFLGTISLDNATPFFLSEWMVASGFPKPIQGRISAALKIKQDVSEEQYQGNALLSLYRMKLEHAVTDNDPMVNRVGYNSIDLIHRLENEKREIKITLPLSGVWQRQPLNAENLGMELQKKLHDLALHPVAISAASEQRASTVETRIRLHESGNLSLNERIRLRKVLKKMYEDPTLIVDLNPKWSGESLDWESMQRIEYSLMLIERFLNHRGISKRRIFPTVPTDKDRAREIASIWVTLNRIN